VGYLVVGGGLNSLDVAEAEGLEESLVQAELGLRVSCLGVRVGGNGLNVLVGALVALDVGSRSRARLLALVLLREVSLNSNG